MAERRVMKLRRLAAIIIVLTLAGGASAAQTSPAPADLLAAIAASQSAKIDYAFDVDFTTAKTAIRVHFDPKATPRIHTLEPSASQLNSDQRSVLNALQSQIEGIGWCAGEHLGQIADVHLERQDRDTVSYSFQPTRQSTPGQGAQYANRLRGELTLTKTNPDVTAIHIYTPAAFDPLPLVHIANLDIAVTCAVAPNGRRYGARSDSRSSGSAFGLAFDEHNVENVANLSAPQ